MPNELVQSLGVPFLDLIVLAVLVLGSLLYTFMVSRGKLLSILVSTYMAYVLVQFTPFLDGLADIVGFSDPFVLQIILFGVVFLLILLILSNVIFQTPIGAETLGLAVAFLFSFLQVGFLIAVFFSFLPPEILETFSPLLQILFINDTSLFLWAATPVVFLIYLGRRVNRRINDPDFDYDDDYYDYDDEEYDD